MANGSELNLLSQKLNMLLQNKLWLSEQMHKLRKEYPDQYVAADQGKIVGHNNDLVILLNNLRRKFGKHIDHIAIDYVSAKKIELILH